MKDYKTAGEVEEPPTTTEGFIDLWSKFLREGAIRMLKIVVEIYPELMFKEELQEKSGITSDGTFGTYLADLKKNNLIKVEGKGITASKELF